MPPGPAPGAPRRWRGRPSTLTPELTERIVAHLMEFAFFETACNLEGVPAATGREWLLRGKYAWRDGKAHLKTEAPFAEFSAAVDRALSETEKQLGKGILFHGKKDWKALAWLGKAKFPHHFGDHPTTVLVDTEERQLEDGTVEETTTVSVARHGGDSPDLTDDDYAEAAAFLLRRKRQRLAAVAKSPEGKENG